MIKAFFKIFLLLLLCVSQNTLAQVAEWYRGGGLYHPFQPPTFFIGKDKAAYPKKDTINLKVSSVKDVQLIIDAGFANDVIAVHLDNAYHLNLTEIFMQLNKLPRLTCLEINDPTVTADDGQYQLPTNITSLQQLIEISFTYTNTLDMADALTKLSALKHLQRLAIIGTDKQLPASIANFKNLKRIAISPANIGTNDLSNTNWENVDITTGALQPFVIGAPLPKPLAGDIGLLNLAKVKSIRHLEIYLPYLENPGVLSNFTQLTKLSISGSRTPQTKIIKEVGKLKNLKSLSINLSSDRDPLSLTDLQDLSGLKNLSFFGSFSSPVQQIQNLEELANFKELETLSASYCNILTVPDIFYGMQGLKRVSLPGNKLSSLPISLFNLPALVLLDLSGNKLLELPQTKEYHCNQLKVLNLKRNGLTTLPSAITNLLNLENIDVSENNLISAGSGWANLSHVRVVNLAQNRLEGFPDGLQNNHNVKHIELFKNLISTMPVIEAGDYQLEYLGMSANLLTSIPEDINRYKKMHSLSFEYNRLKSLPATLNTYKHITKINLDGSIAVPLTLPACLKYIKLQSLRLANNPLLDKKSVFEAILSMFRPEFEVSLSGNGITELPTTSRWANMQFKEFDLIGNQLKTLPTQFASAKIKGAVILSENPIKGNGTQTNTILTNPAKVKIFYDELGVPLPSHFKVSSKQYAKELTANIHELFSNENWAKVVEYAQNAIKADSVTYAKNVYFNMVGIARIHLKDYDGGVKDLKQYLEDLKAHKHSQIYAIDDANEVLAATYLRLNKPLEAAKIYADLGGLVNLIKVNKICKEFGNTDLPLHALDTNITQMQEQMSWYTKDRYDSERFTVMPKGYYPRYLLIRYASLLIFKGDVTVALDVITKPEERTDDKRSAIEKALVTAAAKYLMTPTNLDKIKSELDLAVSIYGKIDNRWYVPFQDWLPYTNYTTQQQEALLELQAIAK